MLPKKTGPSNAGDEAEGRVTGTEARENAVVQTRGGDTLSRTVSAGTVERDFRLDDGED